VWPEFHNGAATALRLSNEEVPHLFHSIRLTLLNLERGSLFNSRLSYVFSKVERATSTWIVYNKTGSDPTSVAYAGLLFGLGLRGCLKFLALPKVLFQREIKERDREKIKRWKFLFVINETKFFWWTTTIQRISELFVCLFFRSTNISHSVTRWLQSLFCLVSQPVKSVHNTVQFHGTNL
jgi:hypothetical protein